jgi:hypothetical protein
MRFAHFLALAPLVFAVACGCPKDQETVDPDAHHKVAPDWVPDESLEEGKQHEVDAPEVDPYADLNEEERMDKAKELYSEAEGLAGEENWKEAELKYEEAYHLMPGKHGFAYKVAMSALKAGDCPKARSYLEHYILYGDIDKHEDRIIEAKHAHHKLEC